MKVPACDWLAPAWFAQGSPPCLRPAGHEGPHKSLTHEHGLITWTRATDCACHDCTSSDPTDACIDWTRL